MLETLAVKITALDSKLALLILAASSLSFMAHLLNGSHQNFIQCLSALQSFDALLMSVSLPLQGLAHTSGLDSVLLDFQDAKHDNQRLALLKQYAKRLPAFPLEHKAWENRVMGCTAQVLFRLLSVRHVPASKS